MTHDPTDYPPDKPPTKTIEKDFDDDPEYIKLRALDGKEFEIKNYGIVGREGICCQIFENNEAISRKHAQFFSENGKWYVIDLQSKNGTFLKIDEKITKLPFNQKFEIKNNQKIFFDKNEMIIIIDPAF